MREVDQYPWGDLSVGCYVYDATGVPWKLQEAHPTQPYTFLATSQEGKTAVLSQPPEKRVRAWVATSDEAAMHLQSILGARALEGQMKVEAFPPTSRMKFEENALRSHLSMMHGAYSEPSMKYAGLIEQHTHMHAAGEFNFPHTHEEF